MIHLAPHTKSSIVSKSIGYKNSKTVFRGMVDIRKDAHHSYSRVQCDSLQLDEQLINETLPYETVCNQTSIIEHEASITKINDYQLEYLMSREIDESTARHLLVLGFIDIFTKELPMEYAVELNRLLKINF